MGSVARSPKGFPIFNNTPSTVADLQLLSDDMADNIDRRVPTTAGLDSIPYKYSGMTAQVADNTLWVYSGSGWLRIASPDLEADVSTFGNSWQPTNTTGHKPRLRRTGNQVFLYGAVSLIGGTSGVTNFLTIPTEFRPVDGNTRFVGSGVTNQGSRYQLAIANGVLQIPAGYLSGNINTVGDTVPVLSNWSIN